MKRIIPFCGILILWATSLAQSGNLRLGDQEFAKLNYTKAVLAYEAASDKTLRAYRNLAVCYQVLGKLDKAEVCLARVCASSKRQPEDYWDYSQVLLQQGKYQKAKKVFDSFYRAAPRDPRARLFKNQDFASSDLLEKEANYKVQYLSFNSHEQDLAPVLFKKKLVFASTRRRYSPILRQWNGNNRSFLDLYWVNPRQKEAKPVPFPGPFNKKFHEGPIAFSEDGKTCVLTRSNYRLRDGKGEMNFGLYLSHLKDKKWSSLVPFPYNDSTYSVGHACLSQDGTTMYFTSDMPGGKGGTDIWMSSYEDSSWTEPIAHVAINTAGDEMFPFILESGILLFSSNGHVGLGGLDLFASKPKKQGGYKIRNLGSPVNSKLDDFGLITNPSMRHGYFTSNRPAPEGNGKYVDRRDSLFLAKDDDLYSVKFLVPFDFGRTIAGNIVGENGKPVEGVRIGLTHKDGTVTRTALSNEFGDFVFNLDKLGTYFISGSKTNYFNCGDTLVVDSLQEDYQPRLHIRRDPNISIQLVITDSELGIPMPGVSLTVRNLETRSLTEHVTDRTGSYAEKLPQKRLRDSLSYVFQISKPGYLTKTLRYRKIVDQHGRYLVHRAQQGQRNLDFSMRRKTIGDDLALQLGILPYFFDTLKSQIEPNHTELLDEIVLALNDNPALVIEVVNHTDCRGTPSENQKLSEARAKAIWRYILDRLPEGSDRVKSRGRGSSVSKSLCNCDGFRGNDCLPTDYQIDRRTQFIITAIE